MKKNKPTSQERVEHVLQAIELTNRFTQPHDLSTFLQDEKMIEKLDESSLLFIKTYRIGRSMSR